MGNVKKQKTRCVVVAAQQTLETLCVIINYLCQGDHDECALCDQPTQASLTPVVQLISTRDLLEILDAAEDLTLAISKRVLTSVFLCLSQITATCGSVRRIMSDSE